MQFHMTYARSAKDLIVPYAEWRNIPIMTNASHRYSDVNGFLELWDYDTPHIVDSSGYTVMKEYGGYPWSVEDYHNWLSSSGGFDWAAVMDYACEEKFDEKMSVQERMDRTIENTIEHFELDPDYNLLPVLQGRTVEQYLESYDRLKEHGIPVDRVGLGTVCRISSSKKIVETERRLREETDIEWIHGFGVKINAYKLGATFESADSQAWVYPASNGNAYIEGDGKLETVEMGDSPQARTFSCFKSYYDYVNRIANMKGKYECSDCDFCTNDKEELVTHSMENNHRM